MEEICSEYICRRCGSFSARLLGAAFRRAGKIRPATFPGRYRDFLCCRHHDGAGRSMGADCQRRTVCKALTVMLLMATRFTDDDTPGLGIPIASSLPHRAKRGDVQPGDLCNDGDGGDYQRHAEQLCRYQLPDRWIRHPGCDLFQIDTRYILGADKPRHQPSCLFGYWHQFINVRGCDSAECAESRLAHLPVASGEWRISARLRAAPGCTGPGLQQ